MPQIVVVGISHKTAPVEQREKLSFTDAAARSLGRELVRHDEIAEAVVLSTCNRTEVYVHALDTGKAEEAICRALVVRSGMPRSELDCIRYAHLADHAVAHLLRVASSLDSMVVGESEIQGQVRSAWEACAEEGSTGVLLDRLFRQALETGKRVRTETRVAARPVSVSTVAADLAREALPDLGGRRGLVVGGGRMAEATARALMERGLGELVVINRTVGTAREIAERLGGLGLGFDCLAQELAKADVVVCSTDAPHPIISAPQVTEALADRPGRPMVLIDIAVPRDVAAPASAVHGAVLFDIDDLERVVAHNRDEREEHARRGEVIVVEEAERYADWRSGLSVTPVILSLRELAEAIRVGEVARVTGSGEVAAEEEIERIDRVTRAIVNKLLHEPTVRAREAAASADGLRHVESLRHLFGLDLPDRGPTHPDDSDASDQVTSHHLGQSG
ncbi:MAG: glutamyl-tRNA reductase [Thermoleophilia bacterium]|nr:glutamyl-tRNA reductase [Thermoleophilia bacterium]